jgi:uncharacterized protein YecA (UPF0149 family)
MTLSELDGYVTGILACSEMIAPSEWLPHVWGETGEANFSDLKAAEEIAKAHDAKFQFLVRENDVELEGARFLMYQKRRVEINAMTTGEILELIERAFEEHATKVLPDQLHLEGAWKEQLLSAHLEKVEAEMRDELISHEMPENLMENVEAILKENPSKSWDQAVREVAGRTLV